MKNTKKFLILASAIFSINFISARQETITVKEGKLGGGNKLTVKNYTGQALDTANNKVGLKPNEKCVVTTEVTSPASSTKKIFSNVVMQKRIIACESGKIFRKFESKEVPTTEIQEFEKEEFIGVEYKKSKEKVGIPENSKMTVYFENK